MTTTNKARRRKRTPGVLRKLRAKTQGATIHITEEDDWETEVPNVKLSKVFAVVLLLHVVAVGGIVAFQMFSTDETAAGAQGTGATPGTAASDSESGTASGSLSAVRGAGLPPVDMGPQGVRTYTVQTGDDIYAIARRLAVTVEDLEKHNGLDKGNPLRPGMRLSVPSREIAAVPQEELQNIIRDNRGGTIEPDNKRETPGPRRGLAMKSEADASAIPAASPVGEVAPAAHRSAASAALPAATPVTPQAASPSRSSTAETSRSAASVPEVKGTIRIHEVQKGDTAYGIGKKYGVSPDEILRLNAITDPGKLRPGQKLKIVVK